MKRQRVPASARHALLAVLALAGCHDSAQDGAAAPGAPLDIAALDEPPEQRWIDAAADYALGGVEIVDPYGALDGKDLAIDPLETSGLGDMGHALAAWSMEPSGELDAPIYVRFPLPEPAEPGETLELWTEDDEGWWGQSIGVVTGDGRHLATTMLHFSKQAVTGRDVARAGFVSGQYCNGETADAPPLALCVPTPGPTESGVVGAIAPAAERPTHATMFDRLVDLGSPERLGDRVVFKNEESPGASTACDGTYAGRPGFENEDYFGDPALVEPLVELERLVRLRSCGSLKLLVTETFDTMDEHTDASLHYEGRAVDLSLIGANPSTGAVDCQARRYTFGLGRLAQLAVEAGFGHVEYEAFASKKLGLDKTANRSSHHVHASVAKKEEDPLAPNTFEATLQLDGMPIEFFSTDMVRGERSDGSLTLSSPDHLGEGWTTITLVLPNAEANGVFDLVEMEAPTIEVLHQGETRYATSGTLVFDQVLPFEDKNLLTATSGTFTAALGRDDSLTGRFTVDDLVFWDL